MNFGTGLGGSVVGGLYGGSGNTTGGAGAPAGTSGPTGSPTLVQAAWGVQSDGSSRAPQYASWIGALAWGALIGLWWVLPR